MSNVVPINQSSFSVDPKTMLDNAQAHVDNMEGAIVLWFERGTDYEQINWCSSRLTKAQANWLVDQFKTFLLFGD